MDFHSKPPTHRQESRKLGREASEWWGVGRCPRSILVVSGDSPADALAASPSDATGLSKEPYFRRSAAADPLFDPVGGFSRVNTDYAPIIVTASARSGARSLSISAKVAVQDLRRGGCETARQAIIIGGSSAIHPNIDDELIALGLDEIFRVGGANRFATAAAVAQGLEPNQYHPAPNLALILWF